MKNNKTFFPESLKILPIWILWKLEPGSKGKLTKVPYSAKYDGRASSTNENTWDTYENTLRKYKKHSSEYDGIGIMLSLNYGIIFIDIDHCVSYDENGSILSPIAEDILKRMGSQFIELSQSKTGIHILALGDIERNFKNSESGVEMYKEKRFVAMTGMALTESDPHRDPEKIKYIYDHYKTRKTASNKGRKTLPKQERSLCLSDKKILEKASKQQKFRYLFDGNWTSAGYGSQSEGDLALCHYLAYWTDCDPEAVDRLFRLSGMYRDKWEREDYRTETVSKACEGCKETYTEYCVRMRREEAKRFEKAFLSEWAC